MICPRCSTDISENETICPFCHAEINTNTEFNDYKEDGFIGLKSNNSSILHHKPEEGKYLKSTHHMVVVSVVFLLIVAVVTIFSYQALQRVANNTPADIVVAPYVPQADDEEVEIKNTIKKVSIKHLYGSWKILDAVEQKKYAIPYFSFAEDGAAQYDYGSFSVQGYFDDYSSKNKNIIYLEIENQLCGLYAFDVTGNPDDGYRLTLKNVNNGLTYYYESAEAKTYKLNVIEGRTIDEKVVGKWVSRDGIRTYEFTKEGRFVRQVDNQIMKGVWTKSDKQNDTLNLKYMDRAIVNINLSYAFFDDALIINDMMYYKK